MAEFIIHFTEAHIVDAATRYRSEKWVPLLLWLLKAVCFIGLSALFALCL
jgi:hypothetical protein